MCVCVWKVANEADFARASRTYNVVARARNLRSFGANRVDKYDGELYDRVRSIRVLQPRRVGVTFNFCRCYHSSGMMEQLLLVIFDVSYGRAALYNIATAAVY